MGMLAIWLSLAVVYWISLVMLWFEVGRLKAKLRAAEVVIMEGINYRAEVLQATRDHREEKKPRGVFKAEVQQPVGQIFKMVSPPKPDM